MAFMSAVGDLLWSAFVIERGSAVICKPIRSWCMRRARLAPWVEPTQGLLDLALALLCAHYLELPPPLEGLITPGFENTWATWLISSLTLAGCIALWRAMWRRLLGIDNAAASFSKRFNSSMASTEPDAQAIPSLTEGTNTPVFRLGSLSLNRSTS